MKSVRLYCGDALAVLGTLEPGSVDACVCDPPYGLEFMGKEWDRLAVPKPGNLGGFADGAKPSFERVKRHLPAMQEWHYHWAVEVLRVLKPGAHLLAFGGTRTVHRLTCAIEDAGFEIRDCLMWLYGSGFPKSLNVQQAMNKAARGYPQGGPDPESPNAGRFKGGCSDESPNGRGFGAGAGAFMREQGEGRGDDAGPWRGWGTALKPAWEPIILARKPLVGTVAANVAAHGTGALNVDGCRIPADYMSEPGRGEGWLRSGRDAKPHDRRSQVPNNESGSSVADRVSPLGRWPANVALDEAAAAMLDAQSGELGTSSGGGMRRDGKNNAVYGEHIGHPKVVNVGHGDSGGASRFFYCAKASRAEREAGLDGPEKPLLWSAGTQNPGSFQSENTHRAAKNHHPTVKPVALMRWLVRLVTPPSGLVLDPFAGSGTTGIACVLEGFSFLGIEREAEYVAIAERRIAKASEQPTLWDAIA